MGRAVPIVFGAILAYVALISLLANKIFCGWNCPIGALQELLHRVPLPKKLKIKLPFRITNSIRVVVLVAFIAILFTTGYSLYAYINPFEFLHWTLEWAVIPAFLITFVGALFVFRPFCYLLCPLGMVTWPIEQIALKKVRVDKKACTMCMRCVKASPCPTVPSILEESRIRPDCHACGICIESCPEKALHFK
jgi:polyferredoxin